MCMCLYKLCILKPKESYNYNVASYQPTLKELKYHTFIERYQYNTHIIIPTITLTSMHIAIVSTSGT